MDLQYQTYEQWLACLKKNGAPATSAWAKERKKSLEGAEGKRYKEAYGEQRLYQVLQWLDTLSNQQAEST